MLILFEISLSSPAKLHQSDITGVSASFSPILPSGKTRSAPVRVLGPALMTQMVSVGVRKLPEIRSEGLYVQHIRKAGNHVVLWWRKSEFTRSQNKIHIDTFWFCSGQTRPEFQNMYNPARSPTAPDWEGVPSPTLGVHSWQGCRLCIALSTHAIQIKNKSPIMVQVFHHMEAQQTDRTDQIWPWKWIVWSNSLG